MPARPTRQRTQELIDLKRALHEGAISQRDCDRVQKMLLGRKS